MHTGAGHTERAGRREARAVLRTGCAGRTLAACILHGDTQRASPARGFVCRIRSSTSASTLARFGACDGRVPGWGACESGRFAVWYDDSIFAFNSVQILIVLIDKNINVEFNVT